MTKGVLANELPDKWLVRAGDLAKSVNATKQDLESPQMRVRCGLVLATWVSILDSFRTRAISPIFLTVVFMCGQQTLLWTFGEVWFMTKHVSKCFSYIYIILTEYVLQLGQLHMLGTTGLIFVHTPTYTVLLCTSSLTEALCTLIPYGALVWPLADTWWRFNDFLLHCCLLLFVAWMKEKLFLLILENEKLLEVRGMLRENMISLREKQLGYLSKTMEEKEKSNMNLLIQIKRAQAEHAHMSKIAEEALELLGQLDPDNRTSAGPSK